MRALGWLMLALGGAIVGTAGCSRQVTEPAPAPTVPVADPASEVRAALQGDSLARYFLPPTPTTRAVYRFTSSTVLPGALSAESTSSAGTNTLEVVSLQGNRAVLRLVTRWDGDPQSEESTSSVEITPDGGVTMESDGVTSTYPVAAFTGLGADLVPASGSIPALRARLGGAESITVPAGTYATVRLDEGMGPEQHQSWYAAGVGLVRQHMEATFSVPLEAGQVGVGRAIADTSLEEFRR